MVSIFLFSLTEIEWQSALFQLIFWQTPGSAHQATSSTSSSSTFSSSVSSSSSSTSQSVTGFSNWQHWGASRGIQWIQNFLKDVQLVLGHWEMELLVWDSPNAIKLPYLCTILDDGNWYRWQNEVTATSSSSSLTTSTSMTSTSSTVSQTSSTTSTVASFFPPEGLRCLRKGAQYCAMKADYSDSKGSRVAPLSWSLGFRKSDAACLNGCSCSDCWWGTSSSISSTRTSVTSTSLSSTSSTSSARSAANLWDGVILSGNLS